jgi:hypothetical protein
MKVIFLHKLLSQHKNVPSPNHQLRTLYLRSSLRYKKMLLNPPQHQGRQPQLPLSKPSSPVPQGHLLKVGNEVTKVIGTKYHFVTTCKVNVKR